MNKGKLNYLLACSSYTFRPGIFLLTHTYIIHTYIPTYIIYTYIVIVGWPVNWP